MQGPPPGHGWPPPPPGTQPPRPPIGYGFPPPPMPPMGFPPPPMPPMPPMHSPYGPPPVHFAPPIPMPVADPATLPLTIYVGKIPAAFDDAFMQQVFAIFGTVTKWNRAAGKAFGFATFAQGLAALQCLTVLNGFEVDGEAMLSKAGSKEQVVLDELRNTQQESNAEGFAEELKNFRSKLQTLIMQKDMMGMIDSADGTTSPPAESNLPMQMGESAPTGEQKQEEEDATERFLRIELENFRAKQASRDREREDMRRAGLEAKKRKIRANAEAEAAAAAAAERRAAERMSAEREGSRGRSRDSSREGRRDRSRSRDSARRRTEEDEAALRRRREVLANMASSALLDQDAAQLTARTQVQLTLQPGKAQPKIKGYQARAFVDEEEQGAKKQQAIVPIDYTEDERMAALSVAERLAAAAAKINASVTDPTTKVDKNKEVVDRIPQKIQDLYSYPIDWALLRQQNIIESRIRPWVVKKVVEYLGEEVGDFIDFVVQSVDRAMPPKTIEEEVQPVLDKDTEPFVSNLWRMLVFYQLKIQDGK